MKKKKSRNRKIMNKDRKCLYMKHGVKVLLECVQTSDYQQYRLLYT